MRTLTILVLALACAAPAAADDAADARQHYQAATRHFAVGEFADAAKEYQAAYKLKEDPALLFNAAQSWRLAGDNQKALVLYKNYLQFYPNASNIDAVRDQISKLEEAIQAAEQAKTAPPTNTVEPGAAGTAQSAAPAPAPAAAPANAVTAQAPEPEKPLYKKWWFWTAVGGGAAVIAVVVAVAVVETEPGPWTTLPTVGPGASAGLSIHF